MNGLTVLQTPRMLLRCIGFASVLGDVPPIAVESAPGDVPPIAVVSDLQSDTLYYKDLQSASTSYSNKDL